MTAPTFIGEIANGGTGTALTTGSHGLTVLNNDVLIAVINVNASTGTIVDNNTNTVFTAEVGSTTAQGTNHYAIFYHQSNGTDDTAFNWTLGASQAWSVIVRQFRGVHADIWDVAPLHGTTNNTGNATQSTAPAITVVADSMGIVSTVTDSNSTTYSNVSNSYTNLTTQASNRTVGIAHRVFSSAGSTGTTTKDLSASDDWLSHQYSLKPAVPAAAGGDLLLTNRSIANYHGIRQ